MVVQSVVGKAVHSASQLVEHWDDRTVANLEVSKADHSAAKTVEH